MVMGNLTINIELKTDKEGQVDSGGESTSSYHDVKYRHMGISQDSLKE